MENVYYAARSKSIDKYMDEHPSATWEAACEATSDEAFDYCVARLAEIASIARVHAKGKGPSRKIPVPR